MSDGHLEVEVFNAVDRKAKATIRVDEGVVVVDPPPPGPFSLRGRQLQNFRENLRIAGEVAGMDP